VAQNDLNVNILANVKGQEQIATLINRVGALEAETKKLQSANTALASSTDVVIRNGVRYNNAMDAQSRALRQNRQGTQQLGMQINDFATSVSSGTSVQQAFTQQLGQVGYAMSMMGGTAGKIGNFLAGPWGAMVLIGAMALGPLIQKLWDTYNAAGSAGDALTGLMKKNAEYMKQRFALQSAESDLNKLLNRRKQLEDTIAQKGKRDSKGNLMFVYAEQKALLEVNKLISEGRAARDAEKITRLGVPTLEEAMRPKAEKIKADKPSTGGSSVKKKTKVNELAAANTEAKRLEYFAKIAAEYQIGADQEWRKYWEQAEFDQMNDMRDKLAFTAEMADATVQVSKERFAKPMEDQYAALRESAKTVGMAVSDGFKGMLTGAMSWKDGIKGIINSVIDELWRLYVVQQIVGFVTNGINSILGIPNVPARADGGHVGGNKPYLVGERGPELFVPGKTGTIIPNKNMGGGNGGGGVTVNVDARGSADPAAVRAQVQQGILEAAPAIIAAAQAKTVAGLRRPRLGGAMK
jgi:hypothetical protein